MVLFFTLRIKQSGPWYPTGSLAWCYIVIADWRRRSRHSDVMSFESSGEAAAVGTAPPTSAQSGRTGAPAASVSDQVMKQCSVFISIR